MQKEIVETIEFLCKEPRTPGSAHSKECVSYLQRELEKNGYLVETQKKEFTGWKLLGQPKVLIKKPVETELQTLPVFWSAPTPPEGVNGKIVPAGKIKFFESFSWDRWAVLDEEKVVAYLAGNNRPVFVQPMEDWKNPVPHAIIGNRDRQRIIEWLEKGEEVEAEVFVNAKYEPAELTNIVANPAGEILVCAHYDSMLDSPGANDNASGVAALLELAKRLAGENVRVILFDAEELNKLGSYAYVGAQKDLEKVKLVLELDSVGFGDSIELLTSEKIAGKVKGLCPDAMVTPRERIPFSDCWPFMKKGIPAIRMLSKGDESYPYFHSREDTPDKVNPETLKKAVEISERIIRASL